MRIRETNVNWAYPDLVNHRSRLVETEKELTDHFNLGCVMPNLEQAPKEYPCYVATTKGGHSVLNVALNASTFVTQYDGDFVEKWDLCRKYIQERCNSVYRMIDALSDGKKTYTGLVVRVEYDVPGGDTMKMLKKNIFKESASFTRKLIDASCKLTFATKEKYFVNIQLQNVRNLSENSYIDTGFVGVTLDVNDRYVSNMDQSYISDLNSFLEIIEITTDMIDNKLEKLIIEGEY